MKYTGKHDAITKSQLKFFNILKKNAKKNPTKGPKNLPRLTYSRKNEKDKVWDIVQQQNAAKAETNLVLQN